jgi:RHS repeat-associated protein
VNGTQYSVNYGQTSTGTTLASSLAQAINNDSSAVVTANANSTSVNLASKASGSSVNYSLSCGSSTSQGGSFSQPSFTVGCSGMSGGANGVPTTVYALTVGYAPDSDVTSANDSVNGNWTYQYDAFNRLVCSNLVSNGTCSNPSGGQATYTNQYDRFGNRWQQVGSNAMYLTFTGNSPGNPQNNNRMDGYSYDAAGNLLNDGVHNYTYDAENRISTVDGGATASYVYDAEGRRVRKTVGGVSSDYLFDLAGHQITILNSSGGWNRGEIYAGGRHLATYVSSTTFFNHSDWLGTERVRTDISGATCESITSLPFGDGQGTTGSCGDTSPLHFTSKERDSETGLDEFGARYFSSSLGRFATPDWAARPTTVPYAQFGNPQSLNLYSYVGNNPLLHFDPDGHCWPVSACAQAAMAEVNQAQQWVQNKATATGSRAVAATATFTSGVTRDVVNGVLSLGTVGQATGTCMGGNGCSGGQWAKAVGGDTLKAAAIAAPAIGAALGGGTVAASEAATEATTEFAASETQGSTSLLNLNKSLASESQMGEAGQPIAGAGTNKVLRDVGRLESEYGGNAADWSKMTSSNYKASDGSMVETHWYQNDATNSGKIEPKSKIDPN